MKFPIIRIEREPDANSLLFRKCRVFYDDGENVVELHKVRKVSATHSATDVSEVTVTFIGTLEEVGGEKP